MGDNLSQDSNVPVRGYEKDNIAKFYFQMCELPDMATCKGVV